MKEMPTFIQLEGILYESLEFEYLRGYETRNSQRRGSENNTLGISAILADETDEPVVSVSPDVKFPTGCAPGMPQVGLHDLRVSLPMHQDARTVQLRAKDRLLFSREIGKTILAEVEIKTKPENAGNSISFKLGGVGEDDIELLLFLETEGKRRFPIFVSPEKGFTSIDLKPYAGLGKAKLVARYSRAFRSTESSSEAFNLPERHVCGRILEPSANTELPAGSRFNMIGILCDENGRLVDWDSSNVFWSVNGKRMDDGRQIALCAPLKAGKHKLELMYLAKDGEKPELLHQAGIRVKERSKAQLEYDAIIKKYLASQQVKQRNPDTGQEK